MAEMNRRSRQRNRHLSKAGRRQTDFATFGDERSPNTRDPARDPKTLTDFDPNYGKTYSAETQPVGGQAPYERQTYGNQGNSDNPERGTGDVPQAGSGSGVSGFGREYGQGFGVGAGHGVQGEGSPRERDYRGNSGTTFGAVVGPDALRSEKEDSRPDDKPAG